MMSTMIHRVKACHPDQIMDQRTEIRLPHESLILIEDFQSGKNCLGKIVDYSVGGMGLRSEYRLEPGADIFIGIENSPYSTNHDIFRAQVVWCKAISDGFDFFRFAAGIKFY